MSAKTQPATIAATVRMLVDKGRTNDQIWKVLQDRFGLDESKRHYPQAYRRMYEKEQASKVVVPLRRRAA